MKIATFNANSIRSRMPIVLDWLQAHQPDYLCIQETKVVDELFPKDDLHAIGYHSIFKGQKSYNGVAILSKNEPDQIDSGFNDGAESNDETRLLAAKFGGMWLINTYVPQGRALDHEMYAYKLRWFERLKTWLQAKLDDTPDCVWCGDMNVARTPFDVSSPERKKDHVCYHEDVRNAFESVLECGFEDIWRRFHEEKRLYSFFDYRVKNAVERNIGWRIDYILASPSIASRAQKAFIDLEPRLKEKPSDHTFMMAAFKD